MNLADIDTASAELTENMALEQHERREAIRAFAAAKVAKMPEEVRPMVSTLEGMILQACLNMAERADEEARPATWREAMVKAWPAVEAEWRGIQETVEDHFPTSKAGRKVLTLEAERGDELARRFEAGPWLRAEMDRLIGAPGDEILRACVLAPLMTVPDNAFGLRALDGFDSEGRDGRGLIWPDGLLVAKLEEIGEAGRGLAGWILDNRDREAWSKRWGSPTAALQLIASAAWRHTVRAQVERSHGSLQLSAVLSDEGYAKITKITSAISWSFGAPAVVVVDDNRYAEVASVVKMLVPRATHLMHSIAGHESRPHQASLALWADEKEALPVVFSSATSYAISALAAKLSILALADPQVCAGRLTHTTLGQIAEWTFQNAKRIQARELRAIAAALDELRRVFMFPPGGTKVQIFDTTSAADVQAAKADMRVQIGLTNTFQSLLRNGITGGNLKGNEFSGDFLMNLTGAMALGGAELRNYVRACAGWNAAFIPGTQGTFDPQRVRTYTIEEWASITNSISPGVADLLSSQSKRSLPDARKRIFEARKATLDDLKSLEERKLIVVEHPRRGEVKILPPQGYQEAKNEHRLGQARPHAGPPLRACVPQR